MKLLHSLARLFCKQPPVQPLDQPPDQLAKTIVPEPAQYLDQPIETYSAFSGNVLRVFAGPSAVIAAGYENALLVIDKDDNQAFGVRWRYKEARMDHLLPPTKKAKSALEQTAIEAVDPVTGEVFHFADLEEVQKKGFNVARARLILLGGARKHAKMFWRLAEQSPSDHDIAELPTQTQVRYTSRHAIEAVDPTTNIVTPFESVMAAVRAGYTAVSIYSVLRGDAMLHRNLFWRHAGSQVQPSQLDRSYKKPTVAIVSIDPATREQTVFANMRAVRTAGHTPVSVYQAMNGKLKTHHGLYWRRADSIEEELTAESTTMVCKAKVRNKRDSARERVKATREARIGRLLDRIEKLPKPWGPGTATQLATALGEWYGPAVSPVAPSCSLGQMLPTIKDRLALLGINVETGMDTQQKKSIYRITSEHENSTSTIVPTVIPTIPPEIEKAIIIKAVNSDEVVRLQRILFRDPVTGQWGLRFPDRIVYRETKTEAIAAWYDIECERIASGNPPTTEKGKLKIRPFVSIDPKTGLRTPYNDLRSAAQKGFDPGCIRRVLNGDRLHHKGLRWEFSDTSPNPTTSVSGPVPSFADRIMPVEKEVRHECLSYAI
jgi:hypothetical protein